MGYGLNAERVKTPYSWILFHVFWIERHKLYRIINFLQFWEARLVVWLFCVLFRDTQCPCKENWGSNAAIARRIFCTGAAPTVFVYRWGAVFKSTHKIFKIITVSTANRFIFLVSKLWNKWKNCNNWCWLEAYGRNREFSSTCFNSSLMLKQMV